MRYLKVLLFALIFFVSMVFFFQNQTVLATEMKLRLHFFFIDPMESISLPFYFLVLAAFLMGALLATVTLVWDKMNLSARHMKANWRVRALEKELNALKEKHAAKALPAAKGGLFGKKDAEEQAVVETEAVVEEKKAEKKEEPKQRLTTATPEDFS